MQSNNPMPSFSWQPGPAMHNSHAASGHDTGNQQHHRPASSSSGAPSIDNAVASLFDNDDLADFTIACKGGVKIRAHKAIAFTRCNWIRTNFKHNMIESQTNTLTMPEDEAVVVYMLLAYLYTEDCQVEEARKKYVYNVKAGGAGTKLLLYTRVGELADRICLSNLLKHCKAELKQILYHYDWKRQSLLEDAEALWSSDVVDQDSHVTELVKEGFAGGLLASGIAKLKGKGFQKQLEQCPKLLMRMVLAMKHTDFCGCRGTACTCGNSSMEEMD